MGGKVWVESEKGKGSKFFIEMNLQVSDQKELNDYSGLMLPFYKQVAFTRLFKEFEE